MDENYLSDFEPHTVGSSEHVEYWIPAQDLISFNRAIRSRIRLEDGFFRPSFRGHIPDAFGSKGRDATAQFVALYKSWDCGTFDVACEISANRKSIFLNWLFWSQHDFSTFGIGQEQRQILLEHLKQCWEFNHIEVPLPHVE